MQSLAKETPRIYFGGDACGRSGGHVPGHLLCSARALDILWMINFMSNIVGRSAELQVCGHHWSPVFNLCQDISSKSDSFFFVLGQIAGPRRVSLLEVSRSQQDSIIIQGEQRDGRIGINLGSDLGKTPACELLATSSAHHFGNDTSIHSRSKILLAPDSWPLEELQEWSVMLNAIPFVRQ